MIVPSGLSDLLINYPLLLQPLFLYPSIQASPRCVLSTGSEINLDHKGVEEQELALPPVMTRPAQDKLGWEENTSGSSFKGSCDTASALV